MQLYKLDYVINKYLCRKLMYFVHIFLHIYFSFTAVGSFCFGKYMARWPALTDAILYYQFQKASGVVVFSCELQVRAFSNYYFSCSEDVQTANNVTANHVTVDVTERYVQVSCIT